MRYELIESGRRKIIVQKGESTFIEPASMSRWKEIQMKRLFNVFIFAIVPLLIAGCAGTGPTPYQKAEGQGGFGYSDYHEKDNIYHVAFKGNPATDWAEVVQYINRRAKEICEENGYQGYRIISGDIPGAMVRSDGSLTLSKERASNIAGNPWAATTKNNPEISASAECLDKKSK